MLVLRNWFAAAMLLAAALAAGSAAAALPQTDDVLEVLSSRPDTVSGGDLLVKLRAPLDTSWRALLNGKEVTQAFRQSASGQWLALLKGLSPVRNSLEVFHSGVLAARMELVNHPLAGPVFSGPHQQPFVCQTIQNGLGPALNGVCSTKTIVQYYYKPEVAPAIDRLKTWAKALDVLSGDLVGLPPGFKVYDPRVPPLDVAKTVTSEGRKVPYIVRREVGVINRAVYDIRFLHEPGQPLPDPWSGNDSAWNGRLVYEFSGGCTAAYRQGTLLAPASHEAVLALGYAVATSTLNIFLNNCNDVLSAETAAMVKEHFIKKFGVPRHTIGWGESAGAMQQYLIAQNYPGVLDGIIPYASFPDMVTTVPSNSDCALLLRAFDGASVPWTDKQKSAATGFATWRVCLGIANGFAVGARNCSSVVPKGEVYDPTIRRTGVRCDIYDNEINVFGQDAENGFAARPLDNVGVQYGLAAFNSGAIDAEQFLELNERVGGYDADGNIVAHRTAARPEVIERAYRNGVVLTGGGGLGQIPIIDWRWYSDDDGDTHDSFRSLATRARLIAARGTAANQVILTDPRANTAIMTLIRFSDPDPRTSPFARRERELVGAMNSWLDGIAADKEPGSQTDKIARNKPVDLVDGCWTTDGEHIHAEAKLDGSGECGKIYPMHADPRIAAGGPLTDDILKCALKQVDVADYTYPLRPAQLHRLQAAFPSGVCDYSRPGVGQEITTATWRSYSDPYIQERLASGKRSFGDGKDPN